MTSKNVQYKCLIRDLLPNVFLFRNPDFEPCFALRADTKTKTHLTGPLEYKHREIFVLVSRVICTLLSSLLLSGINIIIDRYSSCRFIAVC